MCEPWPAHSRMAERAPDTRLIESFLQWAEFADGVEVRVRHHGRPAQPGGRELARLLARFVGVDPADLDLEADLMDAEAVMLSDLSREHAAGTPGG